MANDDIVARSGWFLWLTLIPSYLLPSFFREPNDVEQQDQMCRGGTYHVGGGTAHQPAPARARRASEEAAARRSSAHPQRQVGQGRLRHRLPSGTPHREG